MNFLFNLLLLHYSISVYLDFFAGYSSFSEITDDPTVSQKLQELYHDVNNVDMWVGGLAEKKVDGSELGPLFEK